MPNRPSKSDTPLVKCPGCATALKTLVSAVQDLPEEDDLFLCGKCATLSRFTKAGLFALTEEEKSQLDPEEQKELAFAARNILARAAHQQQL